MKLLSSLKKIPNDKLLIVGFGCLGLGLFCGLGWLFYAKNPMDGFGAIAAALLVITGSGLILLGSVSGRV